MRSIHSESLDFSQGQLRSLLPKNLLKNWFSHLRSDRQYGRFDVEMFMQQILPGKDTSDLRFSARRIAQEEGRWDFEKQEQLDRANGLFSLKGLSPYWDFAYQLTEDCLARNTSISYLFHPWQQESFLFKKQNIIRKIPEARWQAFQKIQNGENALKSVKMFLIESGIAGEVQQLFPGL